jgi:hypothetical protein
MQVSAGAGQIVFVPCPFVRDDFLLMPWKEVRTHVEDNRLLRLRGRKQIQEMLYQEKSERASPSSLYHHARQVPGSQTSRQGAGVEETVACESG